jgi:hypothetical protein
MPLPLQFHPRLPQIGALQRARSPLPSASTATGSADSSPIGGELHAAESPVVGEQQRFQLVLGLGMARTAELKIRARGGGLALGLLLVQDGQRADLHLARGCLRRAAWPGARRLPARGCFARLDQRVPGLFDLREHSCIRASSCTAASADCRRPAPPIARVAGLEPFQQRLRQRDARAAPCSCRRDSPRDLRSIRPPARPVRSAAPPAPSPRPRTPRGVVVRPSPCAAARLRRRCAERLLVTAFGGQRQVRIVAAAGQRPRPAAPRDPRDILLDLQIQVVFQRQPDAFASVSSDSPSPPHGRHRQQRQQRQSHTAP